MRYILIALALFIAAHAHSTPIAQSRTGNVVVTLTDEECKMKQTSNLPYRATWEEPGKTYEGCYGMNQMGIVLFYFDDKSVVGVPVQAFKRLLKL